MDSKKILSTDFTEKTFTKNPMAKPVVQNPMAKTTILITNFTEKIIVKNPMTKSSIKNLVTKTLTFSLLLMLTGCKIYGTSFGCPNARGLPCMSMSEVDKRISSGEIEEVSAAPCKGRSCARKTGTDLNPRLRSAKILDAAEVIASSTSRTSRNKSVNIERVVHVE